MSFESPYDRDTVENCVREILNAVQRAVGAKKNVELTFSGIGRLSIRDSRVKMKFYKDFINQMDGSGKLLDSMQNVSRPFLLFSFYLRIDTWKALLHPGKDIVKIFTLFWEHLHLF